MNTRMAWLWLVVLIVISAGCSDQATPASDGDDESEVSAPDGDGERASDADSEPDVDADGERDGEPETEAEADAPGFLWSACVEGPQSPTLAEKAREFDRLAREQHIAGDGLLRTLILNEDLETVDHWQHAENTILWSGMYLASQAFRYRVTGESEAQDNARTVLAALTKLTEVTGVSGLYGRSMADPDKRYNSVPADHPGWTDSSAEGYAGWRFRNDVSKDGYAGLIFGYAAALEHFDDPELLAAIRTRLSEIMSHIVGNGLQIIDTNGEVTEHGRLFHSAYDDYPGFNAMLAASWIKVGATELQDTALDDFYYGCLMEMRAGVQCPEIETMDIGSYINSMEELLYLFLPDCKQNYDNFDMCYQAIYPLLRREQDPALRARLLGVLKTNMFHTDDPRFQSLAPLGNAFYTFVYAALTGDDPQNDPTLADAVERAVCMLRRFPARKIRRHIPKGEQEAVCTSRLDNPVAAEPIPIEEYDFDNYLWRLDFFEIVTEEIPENPKLLYSPEDYLMAYWLGRMHGIIGAGW